MKKILVILFASLFLIGCQSNDKPEDDQIAEDNDVEQVDETEDTDETSQDDVEGEDIPETDEGANNGNADENKPSEPEASKGDETDVTDDHGESTGYSPDDAIVLVQEFIQGTGSDIGLNYSVDGTDDQGNYRIQVFEVVDHGNGETHTATYGWYLVDHKTGKITDMLAQ